MWLLLGFCLISFHIHSGEMLQCLNSKNDRNTSLEICPSNFSCAVIWTSSGNISTLWRTCLPDEIICNFTTTTSVNLGFDNVALSCCNTDGCNSGLPEYNNTPNGLKCDSCSNWTDTECNTPLSCVGIQECCFNTTEFTNWGNFTYKGCASKHFNGFSTNSTTSLNCYNEGKPNNNNTNLNPNDNITPNTNVTPIDNITPNTNVTPIDNITPNTNVTPNDNITPNTNVTPNDNITPNTNVTPNDNITTNTNVTPNINITTNTNLNPNDNITPNTNIRPTPNTNITTNMNLTTITKPTSTQGNKCTSWLRDHNFNPLLMTLISVIFFD